MNWLKIAVAGLVAGVVGNLYDFGMHGFVLGGTYAANPQVFSAEQANPLHFLLVSVTIWIAMSILFAKTRGSWAAGWKGGVHFGALFGLATFFTNFYDPLVIDGFPYDLAWHWGFVNLLGAMIGGAVIGAIIK